MTDDELRIELRKSTEPSKNVDERWERLKTKANALEWEGKVDIAKARKGASKEIDVDVAERRPSTSEGNSYQIVKEWMSWASERGLNTRIKEKEDHRGRLLELPDIYLVLKEGIHLRGFFPCVDVHGTEEYQIEDVFDALESSEGWRVWETTSGSPGASGSEGSVHISVKEYIKNNPGKTVGENWVDTDAYEELSIPSDGHNGDGRVDVVFESDDEYMLVEVKPDAEGVDRAFGQLLRYRYLLANDRINLEKEDIDLGVAAPEFYSSHEGIAPDIGIRLIQSPY